MHKEIPSKLYSTRLKDKQQTRAMLACLVSRIQLLDHQRIRIVNKDGIDCIYNFQHECVETFYSMENFDL